jgi:hypothetical protein
MAVIRTDRVNAQKTDPKAQATDLQTQAPADAQARPGLVALVRALARSAARQFVNQGQDAEAPAPEPDRGPDVK